MPIIKKIEPPFKTVEEAIAVANQHKPYEYLWKEGYVNFYVFSERYKPGEFQKKVSEYVDNALVYYGAISLFIFPFYICLCSLIFLFDYQEINYKIYLFLKSLYIPIRDPYGWNFSFLISFFINLLLFNHMRRSYNFSILIKSTKINHPVRYFFLQYNDVNHDFFICYCIIYYYARKSRSLHKRFTMFSEFGFNVSICFNNVFYNFFWYRVFYIFANLYKIRF